MGTKDTEYTQQGKLDPDQCDMRDTHSARPDAVRDTQATTLTRLCSVYFETGTPNRKS